MDSLVHSFLFEFISVPIDFPPFRAGAKKIDFKILLIKHCALKHNAFHNSSSCLTLVLLCLQI